MILSPQLVVPTVFHLLAIVTTIFRLIHRYRAHRLWWDDFWALMAMVFVCILCPILLIPVYSQDTPIKVRDIARWAMTLLFTCALWSARISVAVTTVRLLPPRGMMRRIAVAMTVVFVVIWIAVLTQKIWICGVYLRPAVDCRIVDAVGILELSTDIFSDFNLIGLPIYMLWRMNLPTDHRRLLMSIFATSVLTTSVSILHSVFIFKGNTIWVGITAHLEASVSLIVCNLLVVVTWIYRVFRNAGEGDASNDASGSPWTTRIGPERPLSVASFTEISGHFASNITRSTVPFDSPTDIPADKSTYPHVNIS